MGCLFTFLMKTITTFEELLEQEEIGFCLSGYYIDTALTLEKMQALYRERELIEKKDIAFSNAEENGSRFYMPPLYIDVYKPAERDEQAQEIGIDNLESTICIILGKYDKGNEEGIEIGEQELRWIMGYHVKHSIQATAYKPHEEGFKAINKVKGPLPFERTPENITAVTTQLMEEGFKCQTQKQKRVFDSILQGRLNGYTPDNCPHPNKYALTDAHFKLCTQCGYELQN